MLQRLIALIKKNPAQAVAILDSIFQLLKQDPDLLIELIETLNGKKPS